MELGFESRFARLEALPDMEVHGFPQPHPSVEKPHLVCPTQQEQVSLLYLTRHNSGQHHFSHAIFILNLSQSRVSPNPCQGNISRRLSRRVVLWGHPLPPKREVSPCFSGYHTCGCSKHLVNIRGSSLRVKQL